MSLKKLRQKYPQYNDISDLELAEGFYKKHYSDLDETEYYEKMFPEIAAKRGTDDIMFPEDEFNENFDFKAAKQEIKGYTDVDSAKDYLIDKGLKPYNEPVRRSDKRKK